MTVAANARGVPDRLPRLLLHAEGAAVAAAAVTDERASRDDRADSEPVPTSVVASSSAAQTAVDMAMAQQGKPYVWGGAGPNSYDCSGLTQFAFRAAGVNLPHSSRTQATMGTPVARGDLRPGDLVAFYSPVSHVGIYIGNGQMVHAPTSGDVVKVASVDNMGATPKFNRIAG